MKILLLKFRNIGDVLLSTPLVNNLRHHYPNGQIEFCVNKETEAMLTLNPNLNKIITYSIKNKFIIGLFVLALIAVGFFH